MDIIKEVMLWKDAKLPIVESLQIKESSHQANGRKLSKQD